VDASKGRVCRPCLRRLITGTCSECERERPLDGPHPLGDTKGRVCRSCSRRLTSPVKKCPVCSKRKRLRVPHPTDKTKGRICGTCNRHYKYLPPKKKYQPCGTVAAVADPAIKGNHPMNSASPVLVAWAVVSILTLSAPAADVKESDVQPVGVTVAAVKVKEKNAIRVIKDPKVKEFDEPTFARLKEPAFKDGTIELKVLSRLRKEAPDFARGFIGVAFRINDDNSKFECIYLRPTNARADDQVRRNHSIQYFAYPDFKFDRLRKEAPEKYETYADMELDEWIDFKIEVKGDKAKLFLNGHKQPALIVNDLKLGAAASGAVGLFVDVGTEGYFSELKIRND
jgi:hypothetical protein